MSYHHRAWRRSREPSKAPGDHGEIHRACDAYEVRRKAELDAQVRRPGEIPCATCRRPTPIPDLRGVPGRLVCAACADPAPEPQPQPGAEEVPQSEESTMPSVTKEKQAKRRAEVLRLRCEGLTQSQIAEALGAAQSTINGDLRALEESGVALPPNLAPPGGQEDAELSERIRVLVKQGVRRGVIMQLTGATRHQVARLIRQSNGLTPHPSKRSKGTLLAEIESLRNTLRETEEGAAELLEELEQLRASPSTASQIAALKEGLAQVERERLDIKRQLVEAQTAHTLALTAAEDLRRAADAQTVDARAAQASAQREIEGLRAQLAAAEEAARRPPEARRAEVERLELEIEGLQRRLDANPWRRAWEALTAHNRAQEELERAKTAALEAALEMAAAEAALKGAER